MNHQGLGATLGLLCAGLTALSPLHLAAAITPPPNLMVSWEDVDGLNFSTIAQNPVSTHQEKGLEILEKALQLAPNINDNSTAWPIPDLALLYAKIGQPERAAEVLSLGVNGLIKDIQFAPSTAGGLSHHEIPDNLALIFAKVGKSAPGFTLTDAIANNFDNSYSPRYVEQNIRIVLEAMARAFFAECKAEAALEIGEKIENQYGKVRALIGIADRPVSVAIADKALAIVKYVEPEQNGDVMVVKSQALAAIALSYARAGAGDKAAATFSLAYDIAGTAYNDIFDNQIFQQSLAEAENLEDESQLSSALGAIADAYTEICQWEKAEQLALTIPEPERQNKLFQQMAISYARAGNADAAFAMAERVTGDTAIKYSVIWEIARQAAKAGNFDQAVALVPQVGDSPEQVALLVEIAAIAFADPPENPATTSCPDPLVPLASLAGVPN